MDQKLTACEAPKPKLAVDKLFAAVITCAVLSVFACLALVGSYVPFPPSLSLKTNGTTVESLSSEGGAVVDSYHDRVIFLDSSGCVSNVVSRSTLDVETTGWTLAQVVGDDVYVVEVKGRPGSSFLASECVVRYSLKGERCETLLAFDYVAEDVFTAAPLIEQLSFSETSGTAVMRLPGRASAQEAEFPLSLDADAQPILLEEAPGLKTEPLPEGARLVDVRCGGDSSVVACLDFQGKAYACDHEAGAWAETSLEELESNGIVLDEKTGLELASCKRLTDGAVYRYNAALIARMAVLLLAVAYLAVFLLTLIVRLAIRVVREKRYVVARFVGCVLFALLAAGGIVGYYSANIYRVASEAELAELSAYASTMAECSKDELLAAVAEYENDGGLSPQTYNQLSDLFEATTRDASASGADLSLELVVQRDSKEYVLVGSSQTFPSGGYSKAEDLRVHFDDVQTGLSAADYESFWGAALTVSKELAAEEGEFAVYLDASCDRSSFYSESLGECLKLFVALLSVFMALGFLFQELRVFSQAFAMRRKLVEQGCEHPEYVFARTLVFVIIASKSFDAALGALIVRDMLVGTAFENNTVLLGLHGLMLAAGCILGPLLFGGVMRKLPVKKVLMGFGLTSIVFYVLCGISVTAGVLPAYIVCLGVALTSAELVVVYAYSLSALAPVDQRAGLNRGASTAIISGSSLGMLLGGNICDAFGNGFMYAGEAVIMLVAMVLLFIVVPRNAVVEAASAKTDASDEVGEGEGSDAAAAEADEVVAAVGAAGEGEGSDAAAAEVAGAVAAVGAAGDPDAGEERGSRTDDPKRSTAPARFSFKGFLHPTIFCALFCILFAYVANGYKSFLFPLFASGFGFDKAAISTTVAFAGALVFCLASFTDKIEQRLGSVKMVMACTALLACVLLFFLVNSTLAWAVIALVLITLLVKVMDPSAKTLVQERSHERGCPNSAITSLRQVCEGAGRLVCAPALGALLVFGSAGACAVLGVAAVGVFASFAVVFRNK